MSDVKTSINKVQVVGTLLEMNLMEETKEVALKGANGVEKKVTCRSIGKKEFKNPTFLVEVEKKDEDGNVVSTSNVGIDFYSIAEKKLDEHGNIVDNPRFKSMETVFETYLPKVNCKSDEKPTRVKIDGSLRENGYVDKNTYEWKSFSALKEGLNSFIESYNKVRPHEALGYQTPYEVYRNGCFPKKGYSKEKTEVA